MSYQLQINGKTFTVLSPQANAHIVETPSGQVVGLECPDSSVVLTAETLADLLENPWIRPTVERWRVSKDTIIARVIAAGALSYVMSAIGSQSEQDQFVWNQSAWFWSDNPTIRGLAGALGLNADELLDRDPFLV